MVFRLIFLLALAAGPLSALAQAQPAYPQPSAADARAIRTVIEAQLDAFRRDDAQAAFSHAAPAVRKAFRTAERFIDMVKDGYAILYRPATVHFLPPAIIGGETIQAVRVIGPDGEVKVALYSMEKQPDGSWKIRACDLAPSTAVLT